MKGLRKDGKKPMSMIADTTTANAQVRSLSETVRLDARTKLLNPKFYEGMLASGYEGTREITKRLKNTMGWSATSGDVDNFIYEDANDTFIADEAMQQRLMETNPNAFRDMITTFLEANGRGYWETSEENLERLQDLYQEVEDRIEGRPSKTSNCVLLSPPRELSGLPSVGHGLHVLPVGDGSTKEEEKYDRKRETEVGRSGVVVGYG